VTRPRARTTDGHAVPLSSYAHFAAEDVLTRVVMERMLAGVATRRHARTAEPVGEQVTGVQKSTSRSAISRRFVKQTETALAELMTRDLAGEDIRVLMLDGEHLAERCVVVALAILTDGTKKPVGLWEGSTENKTVVRALLADLVDRGLCFDDGLLVVLDGAKALSAAVREVFGAKALIQRCTLHKRRNVADHLPDKDKAWVDAKLVKAFVHPDPDQGLRRAKDLAGLLANSYPGAAASLLEGLDEMFTVARLGIDGRLAKTLTTSNPVESMISIARATNRNVTRWRDGQMVLRWTAAGMLNAERSFRRIKGYKQMPQLIDAYTDTPTPTPTTPPKLSVPPPRIHHGSSPKFHETRDMLTSPLSPRRPPRGTMAVPGPRTGPANRQPCLHHPACPPRHQRSNRPQRRPRRPGGRPTRRRPGRPSRHAHQHRNPMGQVRRTRLGRLHSSPCH
jgi:putative transposase